MKSKFILLSSLLIFVTCKKENNNAADTHAKSNSAQDFSDTVKIPINDLRTGTYMGDTGGLYPHGIDTPSGKYAKDLEKFALAITKLDNAGVPSDSGKILFISIGASTGGHNMAKLKSKSTNNPLVNSNLTILNCNTGAGDASLNSVMNPNDSYWRHVKQIIAGSGSTPKQVQVVYLETEDSTNLLSYTNRVSLVKSELEEAMRVIKIKFQNVKLVYLLGRTRTFGNLAIPNREPNPYHFGWACKSMIEDQINGVAGTSYKGKTAVAPLVTWGWYQWADGSTTPREDGFVWLESETRGDGLHANDAGQDTLATRFQNFLLTDKYAGIWYAAH